MADMTDEDVARVVAAFTDATNRHDIDAMLAMVSDDFVFESTAPPDGERLVGRAGVRKLWEDIFRSSPHARVETEELIIAGDRCTALLRYVFDSTNAELEHVRAVDVLRVQSGMLTEKRSYVKG
jgi:ketosteroid isomerase-like protein